VRAAMRETSAVVVVRLVLQAAHVLALQACRTCMRLRRVVVLVRLVSCYRHCMRWRYRRVVLG
jgi:hypothetical protein